ncbi:hypothetical protein [Kocuria flava]|nr:hypothetical protein [Kocuria flava]
MTPNRYGSPPDPPQDPPTTADLFAAFAGDYLLPAPEPIPDADDTPPALGDVDPAEVMERLHPGRAARQAAEQDKAANPARFGAWAAQRFTPNSDSPEAADLAAYLTRTRTP